LIDLIAQFQRVICFLSANAVDGNFGGGEGLVFEGVDPLLFGGTMMAVIQLDHQQRAGATSLANHEINMIAADLAEPPSFIAAVMRAFNYVC